MISMVDIKKRHSKGLQRDSITITLDSRVGTKTVACT